MKLDLEMLSVKVRYLAKELEKAKDLAKEVESASVFEELTLAWAKASDLATGLRWLSEREKAKANRILQSTGAGK
jgi:hypothetical protein